MIDQALCLDALRGRLLALEVATTGSTTLSATANGFARASGSFITDGFEVGMEVLPAGFSTPNNQYCVITHVAALAMRVEGGMTVQTAGSGRSIVAGLPEGQAWDNVAYTPAVGRPYIVEQLVPATTDLVTFSAANGQVEETGLYRLHWFGLTGTGSAGIRKPVGAIMARFAPGSGLGTLADGSTLRVGGGSGNVTGGRGGPRVPGPRAGQLRRVGGWTVCTIDVPWQARSTNAVLTP